MIHEVSSSLSSFKRLEFNSGFNLLLADKSVGATDRQTRNGAGKTSLVELIHFLTGSKCKPDSPFRAESLQGSAFQMQFDLGGKPTIVSRSGAKASEIVVDGDWSEWPLSPTLQRKSGKYILSNEGWKAILGSLFFGLSDRATERPWAASVRSLFSYFARRERSGGFWSPFQNSTQQRVWDQQVALTCLLGLDWSIPQGWQDVREKEKNLDELRKAMAEGVFGPVVESVATLRTSLAVTEDSAKRAKDALSSFRVLEQYHELEAEASRLTRDINKIADDNTLDRRYLEELEAATSSEKQPASDDLEQVYREVGVVLPATVRKRFQDVQQFHESVIRNRRSYLLSEIAATKDRMKERDDRQVTLDHRRAEIMATLRSHGALEQYTALQLEVARLGGQAEVLKQKFNSAEALEQGQLRLTAQRTHLLERLHQDYREQRETLERAIVVFEKISRLLYEQAGHLTIDATENGPRFAISIHAEQSKGISNMQIFCFDMMLMWLCAEREIGPGFLVHDSHLFDGVDERQVGKALAVGAQLAGELGFQYIVTMNSDAVPTELPAGFSLSKYTLPVRLTDATETGGLFGLRFE